MNIPNDTDLMNQKIRETSIPKFIGAKKSDQFFEVPN